MWHGLVQKLPKKGILYAYKVEGEGGWEQGHRWDPTKLCIDPYAPLIEGRRRFGLRDEVEQFRNKVRPRHRFGASMEHPCCQSTCSLALQSPFQSHCLFF